jgi:tetratricopeptide (TPR) repeat protein
VAETRTDMVAAAGASLTAGDTDDNLSLKNYLGILESDPDSPVATRGLLRLATLKDAARLGEDPVRLLEAARQGHESRGDMRAVATLLQVETHLVTGDAAFESDLWKELGRIRSQVTLEPEAATEAYRKVEQLTPGDVDAAEALKRLEQAEGSWKKFAKRFVEEADSATDLALKTSLLVRAAALVWQYKKKGRDKEADKLFSKALELDPANVRAALLFEQTLRAREAWSELAAMLLSTAEHVRDKADQINFFIRAGRVFRANLRDANRAAACYERVLDLHPGNGEAMTFLSGYFTETEQWDHLVGLYEDALQVRQRIDVEQGFLMQIGMVHWRMRKKPDEAEPHFARLRKLDPAHPVVLEFYRERHVAPEEAERLLNVLSDAQRVATTDAKKLELAVEFARRAQQGQNTAERAIEGWRLVQRLDPTHAEASKQLRELYHATHKWNALVEALKAELEACGSGADVVPRKVEILRELVVVYDKYLRMDGMLINTYNAILKLVPGDRPTLDALAAKYESMGRWNDLINVLGTDADAISEPVRRIELYLRVASLWVEHFSNYNQATGPLEKVLAIEPENREALVQLKDIYSKKRAWKELFEVLRKESSVASDPTVRLSNSVEMARLAADRLHSYDDAMTLWREVLAKDPTHLEALDALEKLAEREKAWDALAEVLEKRIAGADSDESRIKLLQKLAAVFAEKLQDAARAAGVWRQVLKLDPQHHRAIRALRDSLLEAGHWDELEKLYLEARDFEGLLDVLSSEADKAAEPELKVDLSFRAAGVIEKHIGEPARAVRSYERVLSVQSDNMRAAQALAPIYEREEKWSRLAGVLELVLRHQAEGDKAERLSLLTRLRELSADKLRDAEAAFGYAHEAYQVAPEAADVREALEASAQAAQAFGRLVEIYQARIQHAGKDEVLALRRRIASLASDRLSNSALAIGQFQKILEADPGDTVASETLERMLRAESKGDDLKQLLRQRLEHGDDPAARWSALKELARLEEESGALEPAAAHYRAMTEIDPADRDVLAHLDRLAEAGERWDELASVLERRREVEQEKASRVDLGYRLGSLLLTRFEDSDRALDVFVQVLELEPGHGLSLGALEKLAEGQKRPPERLLQVLERVYEENSRYDKLLKVLSHRLESETGEEEVRRLRLRVAEISGSKLGDATGAYGSLEAAFLDEPSDRALWDQLAEAAQRADQMRALAGAFATAIEAGDMDAADACDLAERVASIYDEVLSQPEEAEPFHRRVLARDPLSDSAFTALKELYTNQERWDELQLLYKKRIDETFDSEAKLDLLLQVCFLFEEILEKPDLAVEAYQAVLELQPDHGPARRTLERLYQSTERWRDLVALLRSNLDQAQEGKEQVELLFRLGELHENKLGEPAQAVEQYEAVLAHQPTHMRAQEALARLLAVESQRLRVARILEPIYESQGAYQDLARVLEIQLLDEAAPSTRAELLLRIGELYEHRVRNADLAFSAYARAVEADPADGRTREALARVASQRETFRRERAAVLERAVQAITDSPDLVGEILVELGDLLVQYLQERDAAERVYARLIEVDPEHSEHVLLAARALERIHTAKEDHGRLAQDLRNQVRFESSDSARDALLQRLATLHQDVLSDVEGAIQAHRERLEIDPGQPDALAALERLYEQAASYPELIEVLTRRAEVVTDDEVRRTLGRRIGQIHDERLGDKDRAIDAYREVIERHGPDAKTLSALADLYEAKQAWQDLLDTLQLQEESATDDATRTRLRFAMAELMRSRTGEPERALEIYERVLQQEPAHAGALAALDVVMADEAGGLSIAAARVAVPRYEATGATEKLLGALQVQARSEEPGEALAALRRAAEVADQKLGDPGQAFTQMGKALGLGAGEPSVAELLREYGRLAEKSGRFVEYVARLREVVTEIYDGAVQCEVYRTIARTARNQLRDMALALEYYAKLVEERSDDADALDALEQLNEEAGNHAALIEVLARKAELAAQPAERQRLLLRQADIYERGLDDRQAAIDKLEEVLVDAALPDAYAALERLLTAAGRHEDLRALYEAQLDRGVGEAVSLRYRIARTCRQQLGDTERALESLRDALTDDPGHAESIALLEAIMSEAGEFRAQAAAILEPGYLARMQWPQLVAAIEARIEAEQDSEERARLLVRLSQIYEDQLEDFDGTMEVYARLYREDPRDEAVWERLTRLAKNGDQWGRLAKILASAFGDEGPAEDEQLAKLARYVGEIYQDRVGNPHQAGAFFRRAHEFDPSDLVAFTALEKAYRQSGDTQRLLALYTQQAEHAAGDQERVEYLHRRARIFNEELVDATEAVRTYREILDIAPGDLEATVGLETLLAGAEDWQALAEHQRHRVDQALGTPAEADLRFALGVLQRDRLSDLQGAIDTFEEVTRVNPNHAPTVEALELLVQDQKTERQRLCQILEPIYRHQDQWKKLIAIYEAQLELTEDPIESVRLLADIGELHEKRGRDRVLALHAWTRAFVLEPGNEDVRSHVDRLAAEMDAWDEHVQAYEAALKQTDDAPVQATLLAMIARVHDEKRGDPRAAIAAYERLTRVDTEDSGPLDTLESLLTMVGDWVGLVGVLERKVEQAYDTEEKCELLRRVGSVHDELLQDREAAIAAYRRATIENDTDELAFEALDRLFTAKSDAVQLAGVLRRRVEICSDSAERAQLGIRLGALAEHHLRASDEAIEAYRRVLDDDPTNGVAIASLAGLYEREGMWTELLDNLRLRASLVSGLDERATLLTRAGQVLESELNDATEAVELYRQALEELPNHDAAIAALMRMTHREELRARATEIVEPLLREQARWDDLVKLVEGALPGILDPYERRTELTRLAEIHEHGRGKPADAFDAFLRALVADPADAGLQPELERLARALSSWDRLASALGVQAAELSDPVEAANMYRRLARICEEELRDDGRAIEAFVAASGRDDDATETLVDLDRLYQKTQRWNELLDVLERRVAVAASPSESADLLIRLGQVREQHLDDGRGAFVAYEEVLQGNPSDARALEGMERLGQRDALAHDVLEVLDRCYRESGALDKVVGLYDIKIRLAQTDAERLTLLNEAASIWEHELNEPARALENKRRVFELDPQDLSLLEELERLAEAAGAWPALRGMVEGLAASGKVTGRRLLELAERAVGWYRDRLGDLAAEEAALRVVLGVDAARAAEHARLVELLRSPGREAELVGALRAWAAVEGDPAAKRERLREAAQLSETRLSDVTAAAVCYEGVLELEPTDTGALDALAAIRSAEARWPEAVALLSRRLKAETEPGKRGELRYQIAGLQLEQLAEPDAAIASYEALLGEAPNEWPAAQALEGLYEKRERWEALQRLLEARLQGSTDPQERVALRVKLAGMLEQRFGNADGAIAQLSGLLAEDPTNAAALAELERLYTATKRWADLVALLTGRADRAEAAGDVSAEVALLRQAAAVQGEQLGDAVQARASFERIVARDPRDAAALEALVTLCRAAQDWPATIRYLERQLDLMQGTEAVAACHALAELTQDKLQDRAGAEALLLRALALDPTRGDTLERLKKHYEAGAEHKKLAELLAREEQQASEPATKVALLNRIAGLYRVELGDAAAAVGYLERAVQLVPDDRNALLMLCDLYIEAGRQADAIPVLEKLVESYGGRRAKEVAVYLHRLGQAYEGMGNVQEALNRYDAAFKIDLTNVPILRDLGRLCLTGGDLDRAQKTYRALLLQKLGPNDGIAKADVYYRLGEISFKQGDKVKAKAMLERAITEGGQHAEASALLAQL